MYVQKIWKHNIMHSVPAALLHTHACNLTRLTWQISPPIILLELFIFLRGVWPFVSSEEDGKRLNATLPSFEASAFPVVPLSSSRHFRRWLPAGVSPAGVSPAGVSPAGVSLAGVSPAGVSPLPAGISPAGVSPSWSHWFCWHNCRRWRRWHKWLCYK